LKERREGKSKGMLHLFVRLEKEERERGRVVEPLALAVKGYAASVFQTGGKAVCQTEGKEDSGSER
jgi:hypothetical protein